jgi:hypothetical protein
LQAGLTAESAILLTFLVMKLARWLSAILFWLFYQPNILVEFDAHLPRNHFLNQYGEA